MKISLNKDTFKALIGKINRLVVFKATGNYRGEIMRGEIVENSEDKKQLKKLRWLLIVFNAFLGVMFIILKSLHENGSQIMGISSVKIKEGADYLSIYGYCMQRHKKTPEKETVYKIAFDEKYMKTGKAVKKIIDTYDSYYDETLSFSDDYYFLNSNKANIDTDLMKQMLVWTAVNNMHLSVLMQSLLPLGKDFFDIEYLLDLYMLPLNILNRAGRNITALNLYEDVKNLCMIVYFTKRITKGNLAILQKKHGIQFVDLNEV